MPMNHSHASGSSHGSGEAIVQKALEAALQGRTSFAIAHRLSTIQGGLLASSALAGCYPWCPVISMEMMALATDVYKKSSMNGESKAVNGGIFG